MKTRVTRPEASRMDALNPIAAKFSFRKLPGATWKTPAPPAEVSSSTVSGGLVDDVRPNRKVTCPLPQLETLMELPPTEITRVSGAPSGTAIRTGSIDTPPTESAVFAESADWADVAESADAAF